MKEFNFESKHIVELETSENFAKLSRPERTAVIKMIGYNSGKLMDSADFSTPAGIEAYKAAVAQNSAKLELADSIDRKINAGTPLTPEEERATIFGLGVHETIKRELMFDKLTQSDQNKLMRAYIESINAELKKASK